MYVIMDTYEGGPFQSYNTYDDHVVVPDAPEHRYCMFQYRSVRQLYHWMTEHAKQMYSLDKTYTFQVALMGTMVNIYGNSCWDWTAVGTKLTLTDLETAMSEHLSIVMPQIDLALRPRSVLREPTTVPEFRTARDDLLDAIAMAVNIADDCAMDMSGYWPEIPTGAVYIMKVCTTPERYVQPNSTAQTRNPSQARMFESPEAVLKFYFDPVPGRLYSSYEGLSKHPISICTYSPILHQIFEVGAPMDRFKMIEFDTAISTQKSCMKALNGFRPIIRSHKHYELPQTVHYLNDTVEYLRQRLDKGELTNDEKYVVQFKIPYEKQPVTWCRGNLMVQADLRYLLRSNYCRLFPAFDSAPLISLALSESLQGYLRSTMCANTLISLSTVDEDNHITRQGLWAPLTPKGYEHLERISVMHRHCGDNSKRYYVARKILRV
jgi:hypothetical protein